MKITRLLTYSDGSQNQTILNNNTDPVGCVFEHGWSNEPQKGYVELHPQPGKTVQIIVDQKAGTVQIMGFWKNFEQQAVNSLILKF